jgi:hypothetical protein
MREDDPPQIHCREVLFAQICRDELPLAAFVALTKFLR